MKAFKILNATEDHVREVWEMIQELNQRSIDFTSFKTNYRANLSNHEVVYLVAQLDEVVIGFLSIHKSLPLHHNEIVAEIQELIVKDGYRGQGIGKKMLEACLSLVKESNIQQIEASCNKKRTQARHFYDSLGFKVRIYDS